MAIEETIEQAKIGAKSNIDALILTAKDPLGQKALIDRVWADIMKTQEFEEAKRTGKPIDLAEAERITSEIDEFILQSKKIPGLGTVGLGGALSSIQRRMHHYMHELREKAAQQGTIQHGIDSNLQDALNELAHISNELYGHD